MLETLFCGNTQGLSGIEQILARLEQKIDSLLQRPQSLPRVKTEEIRSPLQVQLEQTNETKFVTVSNCLYQVHNKWDG